jgi:hypothetical protein
MNGFIVELEDRPGEVARVTEALAAGGVNILVYGIGAGTWSAIGFVASDEDGARAALEQAGVAYRETPVVTVRMQDRPGQAAAVSRRLADAGVNLSLWLPVDTAAGSFTVAVGVDNPDAAREALADQLASWTYR